MNGHCDICLRYGQLMFMAQDKQPAVSWRQEPFFPTSPMIRCDQLCMRCFAARQAFKNSKP